MFGNIEPKISVVIVNYNGAVWLPACFDSLSQQTYKNFEVIFADNASQDNSLKIIREIYPAAQIIKHHVNTGFAAGNNSAVKIARGKYIFLLNTDTRLTPTCLEDLLQAFQKIPSLGCVQPKLIFMHEPGKLDSCGSYFTWTGFLKHSGNREAAQDPRFSHSFPVLSVKGAGMMFPKKILTKTDGLFDESFWCYFEETDFCWRVWMSGYECWYYPHAIMYHATGGSAGHYITLSIMQYHSLKNRLVTYTKNLSLLKVLYVIPMHVVLNIALSIFLLPSLRPRLAWAIYQALGYWLSHLPSTLKERRHIQTTVRCRPDSEWLPRVTRSMNIRQSVLQVVGLLTYEKYKRQPIIFKK